MRPRVGLALGGDDQKVDERYRAAMRAALLEPVDLRDPADLDGCVALCLTGGADVSVAYGGNKPVEPNEARDRREAALLTSALERDIPVLAICRGIQLLNARLGGTLKAHIDGHAAGYPPLVEPHVVTLEPDSDLARILGGPWVRTNSRHHQALDRIAPSLRVLGTAPDGIVEAVEMPEAAWVFGVQWHPERVNDPDLDRVAAQRLFSAFAAACERG
ncbi:MAG: gamma-glutamyl-gamma-aminobutyrate hydrolase family protein [Chloroflexi bacterium]|nr:gamma-glutamyl-gamma-aminobutyrate hydrolase family protein [Chloroflexota bacterium]